MDVRQLGPHFEGPHFEGITHQRELYKVLLHNHRRIIC